MNQPPPVDDAPDGSTRSAAQALAGASMDDDLEAVQPSSMSRAAGGLLAATGGFTVVLALQTWLIIVRVPVLVELLVVIMTLLGPAQVYLGWKVTRMYGWATQAGTACGALGAAISLVWAVYVFILGVLTILAILLVPVSALAAILTGACIGVARRADAARARLAAHGMEMGT